MSSSSGTFGFPSEGEINRLTEQRFQKIREQRALDTAEGEAVAQREFGEGALGRLSEERAGEVSDVISRRRQSADMADAVARGERVSPGEEAAQRSLDIQAQTSLRQLRGQLGAQGIRGGANIQRQAEVLGGRQQAEASLQAQLANQRFGQQQQALGGLESSISGARGEEFARQQENQKRQLQERLGRISLPLQFAQAGALERAAASQEIRGAALTQSQLQAQQESQEIARIEASKPPPSGGKIICTELHRQGWISDEVMAGDLEYSKTVRMEVKQGYWFLAKPIVKLMKQSKFVTYIAYLVANGWATEMAYRTGHVEKGSFIGRCMIHTIEPACGFLGSLIKKLGRV